MTNLTDLTIDTLVINSETIHPWEAQAMTATGNITIKNGVVTLSKAAAPLVAALTAPVATTDDYKRLVIVCLGDAGQAHTVTPAGGIGGSGATVCSSSTVVGDTLELMAYQGLWYVVGFNQWTFA